jgi:hypothetical protein
MQKWMIGNMAMETMEKMLILQVHMKEIMGLQTAATGIGDLEVQRVGRVEVGEQM